MIKNICNRGRGVDDASSNPTEVYNFSVKLYLKRTIINKKMPGCPIKNPFVSGVHLHNIFLLPTPSILTPGQKISF